MSPIAGVIPALPSSSFSAVHHEGKAQDPLVALGSDLDDSGAKTTDMLLGATSLMITFADGT